MAELKTHSWHSAEPALNSHHTDPISIWPQRPGAVNPILYAIPVFLLTLLAEAWMAHRRALGAYDIPDALTSLQFGALSQVSAVFTRVFTLGIYVLVYEHLRLFELPIDALWVWLFALVFYDFVYYWVHRLGHEVNLLWAAHQVHHSSEYFNLSTALRQSATGAFTTWPFYLVMAIIGVPPVVFVTVALIDLLYQYWVHTELVGKLGWVDRVFVTPSNHRVHHGQNHWCIDCNYGGIFILWDRLFGTFVEERDDEPVGYGIRRPLASFNPLWGNLNVYAELLHASRHARDWRAALRVWFASPSGGRGSIAPLDPAALRRFDCATRPEVRAYAIVQYALLLLPVSHFIATAPVMPTGVQIAYTSLLLISALVLGWLLEERTLAFRLEQLRWLGVSVLALLLPTVTSWALPAAVQAFIVGIALVHMLVAGRLAPAPAATPRPIAS